MLLLFFLFITKHFVVDFLLQTDWMAFNKHDPRKLGGYVHAGIHGIATALILWGRPEFAAAAIIEAVVHFIIDCAKMNLGKINGWHPKTHAFWYALGFDQYLHYMTYAGIVAYYYGIK